MWMGLGCWGTGKGGTGNERYRVVCEVLVVTGGSVCDWGRLCVCVCVYYRGGSGFYCVLHRKLLSKKNLMQLGTNAFLD